MIKYKGFDLLEIGNDGHGHVYYSVFTDSHSCIGNWLLLNEARATVRKYIKNCMGVSL